MGRAVWTVLLMRSRNLHCYSHQSYSCVQHGDLDATIKRRDDARTATRESVTPAALLHGYRTHFPCPVRSHYTAVTFSPKLPLGLRLLGLLTPQNLILASTTLAAVGCGVFWALRWAKSRP